MGARKGTIHSQLTVARRALAFHQTMMERRRVAENERRSKDRAHLAILQERVAQEERNEQMAALGARLQAEHDARMAAQAQQA